MNKIFLKKLYDLYSLKASSINSEIIEQFLHTAKNAGVETYDETVFDRLLNNPLFMEQALLDNIISICDIKLNVDYIGVLLNEMNAKSYNDADEYAIIFDELLNFTMISLFVCVFSLSYDSSNENFSRCFKAYVTSLDLQGRKNTIGTNNIEENKKMLMLPKNIQDIAMDCYWASWTFIVGHEIYHILNPQNNDNIQNELDADRYGYEILIKMITAQQQGRIPKELKVYYEYTYLSPIMILELFKAIEVYKDMCGISTLNFQHPSTSTRQNRIFDLFDAIIPDSLSTEDGNDVLNHFYDAIEYLQTQLQIKYQKGKLDFIIKDNI